MSPVKSPRPPEPRPGCGVQLASPPADKGKCPGCGVRLLRLRRQPGELLLTPEQTRDYWLAYMRVLHARDLASALSYPGVFLSATVIVPGRTVGTCEVRVADAGAVYSISPALLDGPLPHVGCTRTTSLGVSGVCGCCWQLDQDETSLTTEEQAQSERWFADLVAMLAEGEASGEMTPEHRDSSRRLANTVHQWTTPELRGLSMNEFVALC